MTSNKKSAILLCGHGTRDKVGKSEFLELYQRFIESLPPSIEPGYFFIEIQEPRLKDVVERLMQKDIKQIYIIPIFLFPGKHTITDIPGIVNDALHDKHSVHIKITKPIGIFEELMQVVQNKWEKYTAQKEIHNDNFLILVGAGSKEKKANDQLALLLEKIKEKNNIRKANYVFAADFAPPNLDSCAEFISSSKENNTIIIPLLLFEGFYLNKIRKYVANWSDEFKHKNIILTEHIKNDPLLLTAVNKCLPEVLNN